MPSKMLDDPVDATRRDARSRSTHSRLGVLLLLFAALQACGGGERDEPVDEDRPFNVVLISIDTLAASHLGLYGYERDTSPQLDR
jgi:hypothetical protein